ncbi:MAG TPA: DUF1097 domain-containing protein [Microbacteriaceae bacterium]|nr:DUF1097 domain-containing protein [Microbacteriaceae bacterium]
MLRKIPTEVVASIFAGITAFIGGNALNLPPWAIFIGWAGTYLVGGPNIASMTKLWRTMPIGSTYALIIVLLDGWLGNGFGTSTLAKDAMLGLIILVVNTALMFTGRIPFFALVPGMFFGFASFFATSFGGFGFAPGNPWAAWISVIAMNALGPVFAWLVEWLTKAPKTAPDEKKKATVTD